MRGLDTKFDLLAKLGVGGGEGGDCQESVAKIGGV